MVTAASVRERVAGRSPLIRTNCRLIVAGRSVGARSLHFAAWPAGSGRCGQTIDNLPSTRSGPTRSNSARLTADIRAAVRRRSRRKRKPLARLRCPARNPPRPTECHFRRQRQRRHSVCMLLVVRVGPHSSRPLREPEVCVVKSLRCCATWCSHQRWPRDQHSLVARTIHDAGRRMVRRLGTRKRRSSATIRSMWSHIRPSTARSARCGATPIPACRWEELSEDRQHVHLVMIDRRSLSGSEDESLYPPELRFLYQDRRDQYQLSPPTPLFEIVVRDKVVLRLAGLQAWTERVVPALQQLEQSRDKVPSR